jgi:hypothetical protein
MSNPFDATGQTNGFALVWGSAVLKYVMTSMLDGSLAVCDISRTGITKNARDATSSGKKRRPEGGVLLDNVSQPEHQILLAIASFECSAKDR